LLLLCHYLHAVFRHPSHGLHRRGHWGGHRRRSGRKGRRLANQANHGSQKEKKLQNAFHSRYLLRLVASKINEMVTRRVGQIPSDPPIRRR
jgi:hypothetical protein